MKKTFLLIIIVFSTVTTYSQEIGQQVVAASGDEFQTPTVLYSYSIGECMVETYIAPTIILGQGFHQLIETTSETPLLKSAVSINVYPNPANDALQLDMPEEMESLEGVSVQIFDLAGKLLLKQNITNYHVILNIQAVFRNTIIVQVRQGETVLKSEIVQKIN